MLKRHREKRVLFPVGEDQQLRGAVVRRLPSGLRGLRNLGGLGCLLLRLDALFGLLDPRLDRAATVFGLALQELPMRLLRFLSMIDTPGEANVIALEDDERVGFDGEIASHRDLTAGPLVALERIALGILARVMDEGQRADRGGEDRDELPLRLPLLELPEGRGFVGNGQVELVLLFIGGGLQGDAELFLDTEAIWGRGVGDTNGSGVDDGDVASLGQHGNDTPFMVVWNGRPEPHWREGCCEATCVGSRSSHASWNNTGRR